MKTLAKIAFIGYLVSHADANAAAAEIRRARANNNFFIFHSRLQSITPS